MSLPACPAALPESNHSGGVNTNEQVTVFHPLNGSGAKGTTGRSNAGRRKQKDTLKSFTRGILYQHNTNARLYRTSPRFPPVYLFFFGVQNQLQGKNTPLSCKRKGSFPRKGHAPSIRRPSRATSAYPSRKPPPRRRGYQRTWYSIPPTQRQWRKRDHGSLKRWPPETEGYPKGFYPRNNISA